MESLRMCLLCLKTLFYCYSPFVGLQRTDNSGVIAKNHGVQQRHTHTLAMTTKDGFSSKNRTYTHNEFRRDKTPPKMGRGDRFLCGSRRRRNENRRKWKDRKTGKQLRGQDEISCCSFRCRPVLRSRSYQRGRSAANRAHFFPPVPVSRG